ncbi:hypothetical protein NGRA_1705 [Nosema granulosis]|uniref:Uncharacterized protein n=1 Tax=Nosema granulosis TaxID=83296 RepID=A0A9P6GY22_9MICR|nr:hypothetical protein NGRA_1705 [Nosema granulosis]
MNSNQEQEMFEERPAQSKLLSLATLYRLASFIITSIKDDAKSVLMSILIRVKSQSLEDFKILVDTVHDHCIYGIHREIRDNIELYFSNVTYFARIVGMKNLYLLDVVRLNLLSYTEFPKRLTPEDLRVVLNEGCDFVKSLLDPTMEDFDWKEHANNATDVDEIKGLILDSYSLNNMTRCCFKVCPKDTVKFAQPKKGWFWGLFSSCGL